MALSIKSKNKLVILVNCAGYVKPSVLGALSMRDFFAGVEDIPQGGCSPVLSIGLSLPSFVLDNILIFHVI